MELHTLGVDGGYTQKDVPGGCSLLYRLDDFDPRGVSARVAPPMADNAGKLLLQSTSSR